MRKDIEYPAVLAAPHMPGLEDAIRGAGHPDHDLVVLPVTLLAAGYPYPSPAES
jgi:hypothetical protein